jgi:DNA-binding response OmpR family regulator
VFIDSLAPAWQEVHQNLLDQCRILIHHEEPFIEEFLVDECEKNGYVVDRISCRSALANELMADDYDLLLTDLGVLADSERTFADANLVHGMGDSGRWMVVAGTADQGVVGAALAAGAVEVTTHPFEYREYLNQRIRDLIQDRTATRMMKLVTRYLRDVIADSEQDVARRIEAQLMGFKHSLDARASVVVYDSDENAYPLAATLTRAGIRADIAGAPAALLETVARGRGPLVVVASTGEKLSPLLTKQLLRSGADLRILALQGPYAAVLEDVDEICAPVAEGISTLVARVRRLVRRARRSRLYMHLVSTLVNEAAELRPLLSRDFVFASDSALVRAS